MENRTIYSIHQNKVEVLVADYSNCKNEADAINVLKESAEHFKQFPPKSIRALSIAPGNFYGIQYMTLAKQLNEEVFDERIKKAAILGITDLKRILLKAFNHFSSNPLVPFKAKEDALEYLIND